MKAKDLAEILLKNPEAEVVHYQYQGGPEPLVPITKPVFYNTTEKHNETDEYGEYTRKNGLFKQDIYILK